VVLAVMRGLPQTLREIARALAGSLSPRSFLEDELSMQRMSSCNAP